MIRVNTESRYTGNNTYIIGSHFEIYEEPWWDKSNPTDSIQDEVKILLTKIASFIAYKDNISREDAIKKIKDLLNESSDFIIRYKEDKEC